MHQSHPKDPSVATENKLPPLEDEKLPGPQHKGEGGSGSQEGTDRYSEVWGSGGQSRLLVLKAFSEDGMTSFTGVMWIS